jgi:phosphohistidine phosphatase
MRTLILIRHAKSDWDIPGVPDHNRPISARGQRAATAIGQWLNAHNYRPDQILSSTALRCRETWEGIAKELPTPPAATFNRQLYHVWADEMRWVLQTATGNTVVMLGHNPGIAAFAAQLAMPPLPDHPKFEQYPTCATTIMQFDIPDWSAQLLGEGQIQHFVLPRELIG